VQRELENLGHVKARHVKARSARAGQEPGTPGTRSPSPSDRYRSPSPTREPSEDPSSVSDSEESSQEPNGERPHDYDAFDNDDLTDSWQHGNEDQADRGDEQTEPCDQ
jgi:hypothetical protein